jgi:hypothetical protein
MTVLMRAVPLAPTCRAFHPQMPTRKRPQRRRQGLGHDQAEDPRSIARARPGGIRGDLFGPRFGWLRSFERPHACRVRYQPVCHHLSLDENVVLRRPDLIKGKVAKLALSSLAFVEGRECTLSIGMLKQSPNPIVGVDVSFVTHFVVWHAG